MNTYAKFISRRTSDGLKIFRHHTEFRSKSGPGEAIGLIVMMNPGEARPESDELFQKLQREEFDTVDYVPTKPDKTMSKVIRMLKEAFAYHNFEIPDSYTIHVENLFNIREKDSNTAIKLANRITGAEDIMFASRELNPYYRFEFFAWGNVEVNGEKQSKLQAQFLNAIKVNKRRFKEEIINTNYPVHPLYMNTQFFLEASELRMKI